MALVGVILAVWVVLEIASIDGALILTCVAWCEVWHASCLAIALGMAFPVV